MEKEINNLELIEQNEEEKGASIVEYALLLALIAIAVIGVLQVLASETSETFSVSASALDQTNNG